MRQRTSSIIITLAALSSTIALASPGTVYATDASMFRADAAHTGVYAGAAPALSHVKWRFHSRGKIISSPTVSGGIVYVGSTDTNVYAVRANDGSLVWKATTEGPVNSTPAVADGRVFAASIDGYVYALDAATGKRAWRFKTGGERRFTAPGIHGLIPRTQLMADPYDVLMSSPAVSGGVVYIGSGDHYVYALDANSGAVRWKFKTGNVVHASPAVADGTVYIGSWDRNMYALDAVTGHERWRFQTGDDRDIYNQVGIAGSAAVANGTVYFGCRDSHFYALDAKSGHLRWKHDDHGSWVIGSPAVRDGTVYFTTSDERRFFALDVATGAVRFSLFSSAFSFSSPSLAGNIVYYGTFDGRLYGVDVHSGKVVERFATDASRRNLSKYLDAHGNLDIGKLDPDYTFEGAIVGLNNTYGLGSIVGSPAIDDGALFIGGTDGTLYALG
jgi:outer membrane protein assembly factor BamB